MYRMQSSMVRKGTRALFDRLTTSHALPLGQSVKVTGSMR
jgi:hypothetical protein